MRSIEASRNFQQITSEENNLDEDYIVHKFQKLVSLISAVNAVILFSLGSSFLMFPRKILSILINIPTSQIHH
jgi:hypothetical protein